MAKNAVTDWSPTDSLNTDIGSTNIAEGCAPGGINDAIRKLMAQIATYITDALHTVVRIGDTAFKLWLSGSNARIEFDANDYLTYDRTANALGTVIGGATCHTVSATAASFVVPTTTLQDAQLPRLDFNRTGTAIWHVGGSGTAGDNSFNIALNANAPVVSIDTGSQTIATSGAIKATGGLSTGGMVRAIGSGLSSLATGPAVEISWQTTVGVVAAYDRAGAVDKTIQLQGLNVFLQPVGGGVYSGGNHSVQGLLSLGGTALGGISGQVNFLDATGAIRSNISWQGGNDFRFSNATTGPLTFYSNGTQYFQVNGPTGASSNERAVLTDTQFPSLRFFRPGIGSWYIGGTGTAGDNGFAIRVNTSAPALYFDSANAATFVNTVKTGVLGSAGFIMLSPGANTSVSGSLDFRDASNSLIGYIQKAVGSDINYANLGGGGHRFTGDNLYLRYAGNGGVGFTPGTASLSGKVSLANTAGTELGYIQQALSGDINYQNLNGLGGHFFGGKYVTVRNPSQGGVSLAAGTATLTGTVILTDAIGGTSASIGGQAIGQATNYSNGAGHKFDALVQSSGMFDGVTPGSGTTGGLRTRGDAGGGAAILQMTNNAATNEWVSFIADPSGDKVTVVVGHVAVFSIDSSGNVRALGTISQGVAP